MTRKHIWKMLIKLEKGECFKADVMDAVDAYADNTQRVEKNLRKMIKDWAATESKKPLPYWCTDEAQKEWEENQKRNK